MASQGFHEFHDVDARGRPAGGRTTGKGFVINWQRGPLLVDGIRCEPNGAFVEDVLAAARGRLEHYQSTDFACEDNARAIAHIDAALEALQHRTREREARGVEGTHEP
jgi:hypothetical protein